MADAFLADVACEIVSGGRMINLVMQAAFDQRYTKRTKDISPHLAEVNEYLDGPQVSMPGMGVECGDVCIGPADRPDAMQGDEDVEGRYECWPEKPLVSDVYRQREDGMPPRIIDREYRIQFSYASKTYYLISYSKSERTVLTDEESGELLSISDNGHMRKRQCLTDQKLSSYKTAFRYAIYTLLGVSPCYGDSNFHYNLLEYNPYKS